MIAIVTCWRSGSSSGASGDGTPASGERRATSDEPAARVDGEPILLRTIDAASREKIDKLHAQLRGLAEEALDEVIDTYLRRGAGAAAGPTPVPVGDDAIRRYRAAHPRDFDGAHGPAAGRDPAVAHAAVRYQLELEARAAAEGAARRQRREGHRIERFVPPAAELEIALPPERRVALVDGHPLRAAEMEAAAALRWYRLRGELFRERSRNLSAAIDDVLLRREAQRRGVTTESLMAELDSPAAVTDAELEAFIAGERAKGRPVPAPERARPYLAFQKAHARRTSMVDDLRQRARIEILLREPVVPRLPVDEGDGLALGHGRGRRLIVYTNYRCAVCRAVHAELDRLLAATPSVRIVVRDFIPMYDPAAHEAARLMRCAAQLGAATGMRRALLGRDPPRFGTPWYSDAARAVLARTLSIDPAPLATCMAAPATAAAIERDTAQARALGFDEAPAFVAEGVPLSGMQSADGLARKLEAMSDER